MTLQEAKDQIAQLYGHKNWRDFRSDGMDWRVYETAHEEVAELYASSKWDEACDILRQRIELNWVACEMDRNEEYKVIVDTTNPEFKP